MRAELATMMFVTGTGTNGLQRHMDYNLNTFNQIGLGHRTHSSSTTYNRHAWRLFASPAACKSVRPSVCLEHLPNFPKSPLEQTPTGLGLTLSPSTTAATYDQVNIFRTLLPHNLKVSATLVAAVEQQINPNNQ